MNQDSDKEAHYIVERVIEKNGNGGFNRLKDMVFAAIVMGAGVIIWAQQSAIESIRTDIAILKLKCTKQPVERGAPSE